MLATYFGIFFDEREHSLLNPYRPPWCIITLILGPFKLIYLLIGPPIRFAYHYTTKILRRFLMISSRPLDLGDQSPYRAQDFELVPVENARLQQTFNIEHVLLNVVQYLHYEDIVNLSLTSRAVREAVFPGMDMDYRVRKLKQQCCEKPTKTNCTYCNKKICEVRTPYHNVTSLWIVHPNTIQGCFIHVQLPGFPGHHHVTYCSPYCSTCYYATVSRPVKKPCKCAKACKSLQYQHVCPACGKKMVGEVQKMRKKRYMQEARDLAEQMKTCRNCMRELKNSARFWVCSECGGECKDVIHPGFVRKKNDVDVERAETRADEDVGMLRRWVRR
jgi:hypothetical protein